MIKKNILLFAPELGGGGVEKNLFLIANYFSGKFQKVSIISACPEYKNKFKKNIKFITPVSKFWGGIKNRRLKIIISLFLLIKYYFDSPNFTVLSFKGNLYCCLICKILGIKVILRSNASITGWSKGFLKHFLYKSISKMADKIIVNSLEFKKEYKKKFNVKTHCIYNPLNKNEIIKNSKRKIVFSFFKKKTTNFISIGRLVDQKDHITILKSFKKLKEKTNYKFRLLIIGKGINKNFLEEFIKKNSLSSHIKIINFQKNPYPYLKRSEVLILSSLYEGLPNVLLESLSLKKFVISSDCPTGPKEILDYGKNGLLFKMKDEKDLLKKIVYYLKEKKKCKYLLENGFKRLWRFDYHSNLKKYVKLMNS